MKKYSTILLVLILAFISSAQVKIKERVEIAPERYNYVPSNPVNFPDSIYEYPGNKPLNQNIPHYGPASTIILDSPGRVVVSVI